MAAILSGAVDFAISFFLLIAFMAYYRVAPSVQMLWLPAFALLAAATALGVGLWLSAVNVRYRDVKHTVPFLIQMWLFATPIPYSSSIIPPAWRVLYGLNPMVGVVEGFRWSLLGSGSAPGPMIAVSAAAALVLVVSGAFYFRRMEESFADIV
jgi:lipopolysaccharide transport system permease protein